MARTALERTVAEGGVAIFPSDGVYGLAVDPVNPEAIERMNTLKARDQNKPSAVLYFDRLAMRELLEALPAMTRSVVAELLPGPVTLVVFNPKHRYPLACGDRPEQLGIRLIEGPLKGTRVAVLQTSANPAGDPPPRELAEIDSKITDGVDLIIDGGELSGKASTVVDLTEIEAGGRWKVLREGAMLYGELERAMTGLQIGG